MIIVIIDNKYLCGAKQGMHDLGKVIIISIIIKNETINCLLATKVYTSSSCQCLYTMSALSAPAIAPPRRTQKTTGLTSYE
jgi:hypothetical protein